MARPARIQTPTVHLTLRQCPAGIRDRLHALAALREAREARRVTLEEVAADVLARGCAALEAELYPARVRREKPLDSARAVVGE